MADAGALAAELVAMADADLRVRQELATDGSLWAGYHPRMQAVHDRNAGRLTEILDTHGWPGRSLVGERAAHAAWLILQHAIGHPDLLRRGLALLQAAPAGEVSAIELAMLDDRIRGFEGRGQLYGTQFDWDDEGQMSPLPIEDPAGVDQRRATVGLGPLAEAVERHRAESGETAPADRERRRREQEAWLERVGWRQKGL